MRIGRRDQAADPAMLTIPDSQKLIATTAGTDASTVFLEKQAKGRASVDAGRIGVCLSRVFGGSDRERL